MKYFFLKYAHCHLVVSNWSFSIRNRICITSSSGSDIKFIICDSELPFSYEISSCFYLVIGLSITISLASVAILCILTETVYSVSSYCILYICLALFNSVVPFGYSFWLAKIPCWYWQSSFCNKETTFLIRVFSV